MAANPQLVVRVAASLAELKKNLAEGKNQIETTTQAMAKLATSFQGDKLVQQAHNVVAAVNQIGGAARLTDAEQARVNRTLEKALEKYRVLGKDPPEAMKRLAAETRQVADATSRAGAPVSQFSRYFSDLGTQVKAMALGFIGAQAVIGIVRSIGSEIGQLIAVGAKLPAVERSFESLAVGLRVNAGNMLSAMRGATLGLVSDFNLMQSANKAMLLGLPVSSEEMGKLAKTATVLGRAMGQDATMSLDDLIKALGRSSPMILDNLGLTVKVGEANERYADSIGKTAAQLSDTEKKMAFYQEALRKAAEKVAELGEQTRTLGEIVSSIWTRIGNVISSSAAGANISIGRILTSQKEFSLFLGDLVKHGLGLALAGAQVRTELESVGRMIGDINLNAEAARVAAEKAEHALERQREASKKAAEAAKKHAEEIAKLRDQLSGVAFASEVRTLRDAWASLTAEQRLTPEVMARAADAAAVLFEKGATLTPELLRLALGSEKLGLVLSKITKPGLDALPGALEAATQGTLNLYFQQQALSALLQQTTQDELEQFIGKLMKVGETYDIIGLHAKEFSQKTKSDLNELAQAFTRLAQVSGGSFADIVQWVGQTVTSMDLADKGMEQMAKGGLKNVVAGALAVGSAFMQATASGSAFQKTVSGALVGLQVGAAFGPIGAAIGAGVGALGGLLRGIFGKTEGRKQLEEANAQIEKLKAQVIGLHGSTAQAEQIAARLGINFQNIWSNQNKAGLAFVQQQMDALAKAIAAQSEAAKALGDTFVQRLGVQARDATQAMLDKLASLGALSADVQAELLAMAGPDFKAMETAANRYGLSLDALGKGFWQAKLDEQFQIVVADFKLLTQAGADAGAVINAMGPQVASLVAQAIQYGTELPAGMRPIVDSMMQAGLLVDENGKKLKGLESLTFAETLTQGIDRVVDKLQELIDSLTRDVTGGFNNVIDAAERFGRTRIKIPVEMTPFWNTEGVEPESGFQRGTGGFRDFGAGTLALLHGREAVVPERDVSQREALAPTGTDGHAALTLGRIERMLRDQPRAIAVAVRDAVALGRR